MYLLCLYLPKIGSARWPCYTEKLNNICWYPFFFFWPYEWSSLTSKSKERHIVPQILVHPGALTVESGFKIADSAFSGGPLGELVQWSDLIATLYILGHDLHLSASIPDLKVWVCTQKGPLCCRLLSGQGDQYYRPYSHGDHFPLMLTMGCWNSGIILCCCFPR